MDNNLIVIFCLLIILIICILYSFEGMKCNNYNHYIPNINELFNKKRYKEELQNHNKFYKKGLQNHNTLNYNKKSGTCFPGSNDIIELQIK